MAEGSLERQTRRMDGFLIDGRQVFARNITNADLERKDEMDDDLAELRLQHADLESRIELAEDADERRELRKEARALMNDIRQRDTLLLSLYVEDENGERFPDEALLGLAFRVTSKLSRKASEYAFGVEDEETRPTTAGNASG
jgi:hypothetical protein